MNKILISKIKNSIKKASREQKLEHFYSICEGRMILDVGVFAKTIRAVALANDIHCGMQS